MVALLFAAGLAFDVIVVTPPQNVGPTCVSSGNAIACGYHCVTGMNTAACAKAPEGVCVSNGWSVTCYDPPPDVRWLLRNDDTIERPACVTSRGIACGFHCLSPGAKCAQTPQGACHTNQGAAKCWDPPEAVRWRMLQRRDVEYASCISFLDHIVCGYHCTSVGTSMACAQSPDGMCRTRFTSIACFDPPWDDVLPLADVNANR
jgi:hypothetical protein